MVFDKIKAASLLNWVVKTVVRAFQLFFWSFLVHELPL